MPDQFQILNQYQHVFLLVCATHSLSETAKQLGLTKSAVSQIISKLESSLGLMLFDRSRRPLHETAEATALRLQLEKTNGQLAQLLIELQSTNSIRPKIGIGCIESISQACGLELFQKLSEKSRQIDMMIGTVVSLFDLLQKGFIDVMFSWCSLKHTGHVREITLLEQNNIIVIPKTLACTLNLNIPPLELIKNLSLSGSPLIMHPNFTYFPESVPNILSLQDFKFPRRFCIDGNLLQIQLVAKGAGWCITQPLCFYPHLELLKQVEIVAIPTSIRRINLVTLSNAPQTPINIVLDAIRTIFNQKILPELTATMPSQAGIRLL